LLQSALAPNHPETPLQTHLKGSIKCRQLSENKNVTTVKLSEGD
jgi:hypothetical protein